MRLTAAERGEAVRPPLEHVSCHVWNRGKSARRTLQLVRSGRKVLLVREPLGLPRTVARVATSAIRTASKGMKPAPYTAMMAAEPPV